MDGGTKEGRYKSHRRLLCLPQHRHLGPSHAYDVGNYCTEDDPGRVHEYVVPAAPRSRPNPKGTPLKLNLINICKKSFSVLGGGDSGLRAVLITTCGVLVFHAILLRRRQHRPPLHFSFVKKQLVTGGCLLFCIEFYEEKQNGPTMSVERYM